GAWGYGGGSDYRVAQGMTVQGIAMQQATKVIEMLSKLKTGLRALLRKSEMDRELDEELRNHIERQTEQNIRLGMNPEEARQVALKSFGGVEQGKERSRDARGVSRLEGV